MTTMISEVYDALKDAHGVSDEKARKAAEAVAQFDTRFSTLEQKFDNLRVEFEKLKGSFEGLKVSFEALKVNFEALKVDFESLKGRVNLIQWQLGILIVGVTALVLKAFAH